MPIALNRYKKLQDIYTSLLSRLKKIWIKEKVTVGLDLGASAIKVVRLKFLKEAVELCDFQIQHIDSDPQEALKKIKVPEGEEELVNISVSGAAAVIRYIVFPRIEPSDLRQALRFEAPKHIPFPINEINLDGCILKENLPENKMLVLIAAVKKEFLNQRLKLLEEAGFKVGLVDIDALSLANAFNFNSDQVDKPQNKTIALLNIGATVTNLDILEGGTLRLSRDIHIAGNNFTQKIMDIRSIDFKTAEALKFNPEKDRDEVITAVSQVLSNLAAEVRTSFDYYESQSTSVVGKIFLSGAGSKFGGLKEMLANFLGLEVEYWDPLAKIVLAANIDSAKLKEESSQLAVAVGLALRK